ncbi:hypothetical protein Tco_0337756 [Tanacetum coccineum]
MRTSLMSMHHLPRIRRQLRGGWRCYPKVGGIDDDILLTIKDDILHEKLLKINLLIAKIEALKDNLTPLRCYDQGLPHISTFSCGETNTVDNSLPKTKLFALIWKKISSGSTTYSC